MKRFLTVLFLGAVVALALPACTDVYRTVEQNTVTDTLVVHDTVCTGRHCGHQPHGDD